jgi:hypothetical protein
VIYVAPSGADSAIDFLGAFGATTGAGSVFPHSPENGFGKVETVFHSFGFGDADFKLLVKV